MSRSAHAQRTTKQRFRNIRAQPVFRRHQFATSIPMFFEMLNEYSHSAIESSPTIDEADGCAYRTPVSRHSSVDRIVAYRLDPSYHASSLASAGEVWMKEM